MTFAEGTQGCPLVDTILVWICVFASLLRTAGSLQERRDSCDHLTCWSVEKRKFYEISRRGRDTEGKPVKWQQVFVSALAC